MEKYIDELLSRLTVEEKISMLHGAGLFRTAPVERLEIPAFHFSDGPMGVRGEYPDDSWTYKNLNDDLVSYLPCNSAVASSWDRELAYLNGSILGEEARGRGKDMILAPGINIKRTPLCGRNFEYLSEDPCLTAKMTEKIVQGIQRFDVSACVKHFAANSQETDRLSVDSVVDEKTLHEVYFPGFRAAVDAGCYGVMGAYNRLNGEFCCTSPTLLDEVLRRQWGFDGVVVSDWGGVHSTQEAAGCSLDMEMDVRFDFHNHYMADALLGAVQKGEIPLSCVDEKIRNILRLMYRLKMIGPEKTCRKSGGYNLPCRAEQTLSIARNSCVLLKNEENILPLQPNKLKKVAVIGANATMAHAFGGGSAEIKALYEITPLLGICKLLGGNTQVRYLPGYYVPDNGGRSEISWQASSTEAQAGTVPLQLTVPEEKRLACLREAVEEAKKADAVIYVGGLDHMYDVEGLDREDMKLPYGQDALIEALLSAQPNTVLTFVGGSPVEMPWLKKAKAVLWMYYNGMEGGTALAEILFGKTSPSGKTAETFLQNADQCPARPTKDRRCVYTEGSAVGYRWYDAQNIPVNFPFGHGLTYTEFAYSDLKCAGREVTCRVKNTGARAGAEIVQLYIHNGAYHALRHFEKRVIGPGQEASFAFLLEDRDFSEYDVNTKSFRLTPGSYTVEIGASSRDIRLTAPITI